MIYMKKFIILTKDKIYNALQSSDKDTRERSVEKVKAEIEEYFTVKYGEEANSKKVAIGEALYKLQKKTVRHMILEEQKELMEEA